MSSLVDGRKEEEKGQAHHGKMQSLTAVLKIYVYSLFRHFLRNELRFSSLTWLQIASDLFGFHH